MIECEIIHLQFSRIELAKVLAACVPEVVYLDVNFWSKWIDSLPARLLATHVEHVRAYSTA